jgi:hypothetical protein
MLAKSFLSSDKPINAILWLVMLELELERQI